mgnify:CR=1 FL=1
MESLQEFGNDFYLNFIKDDRWMWLVNGLKVTILVTLLAISGCYYPLFS